MIKYTLYCTEEQTKLALELGAPIAIYGNGELSEIIAKRYNLTSINGVTYIIPTAEQLIGWLEEHGIYIEISKSFIADYQSLVHNDKTTKFYDEYLPTRKEATIVAIDKALGYLINDKK